MGVLIELARVLAADRSRSRTVVFASFDGEEAWSTEKGTTAGSRAFLERLGPRARSLVGAFVVEMCGWPGGTPVLHPIAYDDPATPAPRWSRPAGSCGPRSPARAPEARPSASATRSCRGSTSPRCARSGSRLYGDDLVVPAGRPSGALRLRLVLLRLLSRTITGRPTRRTGSTPARSSAWGARRWASCARWTASPRGAAEEPHWFAAFGRVVDWPWLLGLGVLSLLPGLRAGYRAGVLPFAVRLLQAVGFGLLLWCHPVPALWVFLAPQLLLPFTRRWWAAALALVPLAALAALGIAAWWRGSVSGLWLAPWQLAVAAVALLRSPSSASARLRGPRRERGAADGVDDADGARLRACRTASARPSAPPGLRPG